MNAEKKMILASLLMLSGCAPQSGTTTSSYSTEGLTSTTTHVLTNSDYDQQEEERAHQEVVRRTPVIKPSEHSSEYPLLHLQDEEGFPQEDLALLYAAMQVEEVKIPLPDDVICEYIPQLRLQKTLGRLTCVAQSPLSDSNPPKMGGSSKPKSKPSYSCSMQLGRDKKLAPADEALFKNLDLIEYEYKGYNGKHTIRKSVGHFHVDRIVDIATGETEYEYNLDIVARSSSGKDEK